MSDLHACGLLVVDKEKCLHSSTGVLAQPFLHNPRGSNNRLNEETTDRANANRVFDSRYHPHNDA